jgi:lipopolysaccharide export system protein LptA
MKMKLSAAAAVLILAGGTALATAAEDGGGILPGAKASDPVKIDADKLDYFDKDQRLIYSGSVIVVNGPSTLKSTKMVILLDNAKNNNQKGGKQGGSNDKVRHVEADGPVTLVSPDQVATSDHMTYDKAENKVHMTGNVTYTTGDTVVKGTHLVYDLKTKEARVVSEGAPATPGGRVQSLMTPKNK